MNTNKYSLESRREQANKYKTWGIVLVVIGFGLFLYGGAKMVFGPQVTASLGSEAWQRQFDAAYNYQQSMDGIISVLAVSGIIIAGIGDVLWKKYKTISAGLYGEELVSYTLNSLPAEYISYNNIPLEKDGKRTEIDTLVVSKYGIFLGEVKNYKGRIVGNENDSTWTQIKTSSAGESYENTIKNPVKQAKFQTYLLSSILKDQGLHCYVNPYVVFTGSESVNTDSGIVLRSENEFHNTILTYHDTRISNEDLEKIRGVIRCLQRSES